MAENTLYKDISERTCGEIYVGVVGPVRTGKSTFIRKVMEELVIPNMNPGYDKERTKDELPQSGSGKTVMTTEPKFVPDNAVEVDFENAITAKMKFIDCVGYIVSEALGSYEDGKERMVMTPWSDSPKPFSEAAEYGTKKVIDEHSSIGIVVTTDGSFGEISKLSYKEAEERVINDLKACGKPFAIVMNSAYPESREAENAAIEAEEKYGVPVALVNCLNIDKEDIDQIFKLILNEFPIKSIEFLLPKWTAALDESHWLCESLKNEIYETAKNIGKIKDIYDSVKKLESNEYILTADIESLIMGTGSAKVKLCLVPELYYKIISELCNEEITDEDGLIKVLKDYSEIKAKYNTISEALYDVNEKGYGIVLPSIDDYRLEEPQVVKQPGGYGVHIKATAKSIHMIKADIETEINPIVGTEQQSKDLINYLEHEKDEGMSHLWNCNVFGKTLQELVDEGIMDKLNNIPEDSRQRLSEAIERTINEGSGGLICIIL